MGIGHDLKKRQRIAYEKGLPLHDTINVHDSVDERWAVRNLLGRTLGEVEASYREHFFSCTEDLMVMGPEAFCFYIDAAISYLKSAAAFGDSDGLNGFVGAVSHRLKWDRSAISPAISRLSDACDYLLEHLDRYDLTPGIYDHVPGDLRALRQTLRE
jgi:hypothetical protein